MENGKQREDRLIGQKFGGNGIGEMENGNDTCSVMQTVNESDDCNDEGGIVRRTEAEEEIFPSVNRNDKVCIARRSEAQEGDNFPSVSRGKIDWKGKK